MEDLPKVFALLAEKKIDPVVSKTFPLLDARNALEWLARGSVEGKLVLEAALLELACCQLPDRVGSRQPARASALARFMTRSTRAEH